MARLAAQSDRMVSVPDSEEHTPHSEAFLERKMSLKKEKSTFLMIAEELKQGALQSSLQR